MADVEKHDHHPLDLPAEHHQRPEGVDGKTVEAVGKVTEALETVERARGHLYEWHQLIGAADAQLGAAVSALRDCGHGELADRIERELVGRNVLSGRWTFQVVEEFDEGYYEPFRNGDREVRDSLVGGRPHVFEAEMKERERSVDHTGSPLPWHAATPESGR